VVDIYQTVRLLGKYPPLSQTSTSTFIYIYLVDKVPQDITSTVPNIYAHMHKLDKKDN